MRNRVRASIFSLLMLIVAFVGVSCDFGEVVQRTQIQGASSDIPLERRAYVQLSVKDFVARTAVPSVQISDFTSFVFKGSASGGAEQTLGEWASSAETSAYDAMTASPVSIEIGDWDFTLSATAGGATYTGTISGKTIARNESVELSFELELDSLGTDGTGSLSVTVEFPKNNVSKLTAALYALSDATLSSPISGSQKTVTSVSSGTYKYSLSDISSGTYVAVFQLWGKDSATGTEYKISGLHREYCAIAKDLSSSSTVTISNTDSTLAIIYKLGGGKFSENCRGSFSRRETEAITLPTRSACEKQDAIFMGWYTTSDCSGSAVTKFKPSEQTSHLTLYAKWQPTEQYVNPTGTATGSNFADGFTSTASFPTVAAAISHINALVENEGIASTHNWTIKLNATGDDSLKEKITIGAVSAASLIINGENYDEENKASKDTIWGGGERTPLTLNNTIPVTVCGMGISNDNGAGTVSSGLSGIVVNGTGKVIIEKSGINKHSSSGIRITGNADVEIKSSWVAQNGAENGGGIYKEGTGTLTITDSTIEKNTATSGGGVYVAAGTCLLGENAYIGTPETESTNKATNGGGMYVASGGTLRMTGGGITNNTANTDGGGVYNKGTVTLSGGSISGNTATSEGGGVKNEGTLFMYGSAVIGDASKTEQATEENCSNKAATGGGITTIGKLYLGYSAENKKATLTGGVCYNYGEDTGGIFIRNTSVFMASGDVSYNNKRGIYAGSDAYEAYGRFTMDGGSINHNGSATVLGGGVYAGYHGKVTINGGTISENSAENGGGVAIRNSLSSFTMTGGTISGNTASENGGGLYSDLSTTDTGSVTVSDGTISGNTATSGGGAYINYGTITLSGGKISDNSAVDGGGLYSKVTLPMTGGTISGNTATKLGGGVYNSGTLNMSGGKIEDNESTGEEEEFTAGGGGIYNCKTVSMSGGTVSGNKATALGGGIFNNTSAAKVYISGSAVIGDRSATEPATSSSCSNNAGKGGGIYNRVGEVYIGYTSGSAKDNSFTGGVFYNYASAHGGGFYSIGNGYAKIYGYKGAISCNGAKTYGGAADIYNGTFELEGTTLNNNAGSQGGALQLGRTDGAPEAVLKDVSMSGNVASQNGSAILLQNGTLSMLSGTISGNKITATAGCAVYIASAGIFELSGGEIKDNLCSGVYNAGTFTLSGTGTISGHTVTGSVGAGIYTQGTFTMSGGTISGNTSTDRNGGGVYNISQNGSLGLMTMTGGTISGNSSGEYGGGICNEGTLNMTGGTVSANTATTNGGGVATWGTMTLGGDAYIPAGYDGKNDVFLYTGGSKTTVVLSSPLTHTDVATLTPGDYTVSRPMLTFATDSTTTIDAEYTKFAVTQPSTGTWSIDSAGYLQTQVTNGISISVPDYTSDDLELVAALSADGTSYVFTAKSGYSSYVWSIDGKFATTTTNTHSVDISTLASGTHTLLLVATDSGGKYHDAQVTIAIE